MMHDLSEFDEVLIFDDYVDFMLEKEHGIDEITGPKIGYNDPRIVNQVLKRFISSRVAEKRMKEHMAKLWNHNTFTPLHRKVLAIKSQTGLSVKEIVKEISPEGSLRKVYFSLDQHIKETHYDVKLERLMRDFGVEYVETVRTMAQTSSDLETFNDRMKREIENIKKFINVFPPDLRNTFIGLFQRVMKQISKSGFKLKGKPHVKEEKIS